MDTPRQPPPHGARFVHPDYRPGRFPGMEPAGVWAVGLLLALAVIALIAGEDSGWLLAAGAVLLFSGLIVAWRCGVSFRVLFRRPSQDDLRQL